MPSGPPLTVSAIRRDSAISRCRWGVRVVGDTYSYLYHWFMVLVGLRTVAIRWYHQNWGNMMRKVIIRCLSVMTVLGGLALGGSTVAAVNSAPTAIPLQTQLQPQCPLGQVPGPMSGFCQIPGMGG
jgi:hypothetical protein